MLPRLAVLLFAWSSVAFGGEFDAKHLGFSGIPIQGNEELLKKLGFAKLPAKKGILVTVVNPGTATAAGGLLPMAIVTMVNKKPVANADDVAEVLEPLELGTDTTITGYSLRNNVWKSGTVKTKVSDRVSVLIASMEKDVDNIEGVTTFQHKFIAKDQLKRLRYFVVARDGQRPELRMEVLYIAEDWLFVNSITAANEGRKVTIPLKPFGGENKVEPGFIVERHWASVTPEFSELTKDIDCTIRFDGKTRRYDHEQTVTEYWINRDVQDFYRMLTTAP
jgi:hypothetical protein